MDITPKPNGEASIVFVDAKQYPADFDFDLRPGNRRISLRPQVDFLSVAKQRIAVMPASQLRYEKLRADKSGMNLEGWIASKIPRDQLSDAIQELIKSCEAHEEKLDSFPGSEFIPDEEIFKLTKRRAEATERFKKLAAQVR